MVLRTAGVTGVAGLGAAFGVDRWSRSRAVEVPLYGETVALEAPGSPVVVGVGRQDDVLPGTRVLRSARSADLLVDDERTWLAASPTWALADDRWGRLARAALLDLRVLTLPGGEHVAGWSSSWRYVWPRDSSHAAAAFATTGHVDDARRIALFLADVQGEDGWFEARYRPDGSGPPDERRRQLDGTGWALWAAATAVSATPGNAGLTLAAALRPMMERGVRLVLDLTGEGTRLPAPSPDYWEVAERSVTLGTTAPLVIGLYSAATVLRRLDLADDSARAATAATSLATVVAAAYGPQGYPRHLGADDPDAAIAFLVPPYLASAPAGLADAVARSERRMRRPAGGVAPGAGWKDDGISWTPETALMGLAYAGCGRDADAYRVLGWLDDHRTGAGSFPEKVLYDGRPASVAPLGWTAALVLMTLAQLHS